MRLDAWNQLFTSYNTISTEKTTNPTSATSFTMNLLRLNGRFLLDSKEKHLLLVSEVCRVWNNMSLAKDELGYDDYMDVYRGMIEHLEEIDSCRISTPDTAHRMLRFVFEMGFQPAMYFLTTKCRDIQIRLRALSFIRKLGVPRESMWDSLNTFYLCRRIIEIEHDVALNAQGEPLTKLPTALPPDHMRVREAWTVSTSCTRVRNGEMRRGCLVCFVLPALGGGTEETTQFLCEDPAYS